MILMVLCRHKAIESSMPVLLPLMVDAIALRALPHSHRAASRLLLSAGSSPLLRSAPRSPRSLSFRPAGGPAPDTLPPHLRAAFADMKGGQIKTLSFLTYMVKEYSALLAPHHARVCEAVVDLLRTCPDVPASRRELIGGTRHIVSSAEMRSSFFPHLDALLDRDVLIVRPRGGPALAESPPRALSLIWRAHVENLRVLCD